MINSRRSRKLVGLAFILSVVVVGGRPAQAMWGMPGQSARIGSAREVVEVRRARGVSAPRSAAAPHYGARAVPGQEVRSSHVIYVDQDAQGVGDGSSWGSAFRSLSNALAAAAAGDEIWVASGVYTPTTGVTRTATFSMVEGVALYGGFAGTETLRQERDWETNVTVLSGDLEGNDVTPPHGVITSTASINGANAFHVVSADGVTEGAVLDGFTITGGQATGAGEDGNGGGVYSVAASPTLRHLVVRGNCAGVCGTYTVGVDSRFAFPDRQTLLLMRATAASGLGGGLYFSGGSPVLEDVATVDNEANAGGGGMRCGGNSAPELTDVVFARNGANFGGGMYNDVAAPMLTGVLFDRNLAALGGGIYSRDSMVVAVNLAFRGNEAVKPIGKGGAVYCENGAFTTTNGVFAGNEVDGYAFGDPAEGGALFSVGAQVELVNATIYGNETDASGRGGGLYADGGALDVANTILWGNSDGGGMGETAQISFTVGTTVTVTYSLLQGADSYDGPGVSGADPRFFDAPENLHLRAHSPAIDAGDNAAVNDQGVSVDLDGGPRRVDVEAVTDTGSGVPPIVDMGAYEAPSSFDSLFVPLVVRG